MTASAIIDLKLLVSKLFFNFFFTVLIFTKVCCFPWIVLSPPVLLRVVEQLRKPAGQPSDLSPIDKLSRVLFYTGLHYFPVIVCSSKRLFYYLSINLLS